MEEDIFDVELEALLDDVVDKGPGFGCMSPAEARKIYNQVTKTTIAKLIIV